MDERQAPGTEGYEALPAEEIAIDQVIAWNMRHWRQARYMTQEQLGDPLGWSAANVSAIERSAEGNRDRRRFDAQTIAGIAHALHIPIVALFLPPEDDGAGKRYQWHTGNLVPRSMADLMELVMNYNDEESELTDQYVDRFRAAVTAYLEEKWAEEVAQWFAPMDDAAARAEQAARFRSRQAALLTMAAEQGALAEYLEPEEGQP